MDFIEKYPECYAIAQAPVFLRFLRHISDSPRSFAELLSEVPGVEEMDLKLILLALEDAGLVTKAKNIQREVFFVTDKAKTLLEKYDGAKKGLGPE